VRGALLQEYPATDTWDEALLASAALWGAVAGQVLFGLLGDHLGRRGAFLGTLALTVAVNHRRHQHQHPDTSCC
jgi:MFS family permease